jgi:hypothetical protein
MKTVEVVYVEVKCIYEKLKEEGQKYSVGRIIRPPSGRINAGPPVLDDQMAYS